MNKSIVIIEDEAIIAENLKRIVTKYGYNVLAVANTFEEAKTCISNFEPVVFLIDINLNSTFGTGVDIAKIINKKSKSKHIYVTANADEKTLKLARITKPLGYITKPFQTEQIVSTLSIVFHNIIDVPQLEIRHKGDIVILKENDIIYCKSDGIYVEIYTEKSKYLHRSSFKELTDIFNSSLVQIHKSYLINIAKIASYNSKEVTVGEKVTLPIGRAFRIDLKSYLSR